MLFESKTLIVVYKDELMLNQFRKLVETNDDTNAENIVGVTDGSVRIVAWTEKVWKDQKKAGNINNKVLFLGNVADSEKLIPVIDVKYDNYGVIYGWAGNQALIFVSPKKLNSKEFYNAFLGELTKYSLPDQLKPLVKATTEAKVDANIVGNPEDATAKTEMSEKKRGGFTAFVGKAIKATGNAVGTVTNGVKNAVSEIDSAIDDLPADRGLMARQQLFFGIMKMYENNLEGYMQN